MTVPAICPGIVAGLNKSFVNVKVTVGTTCTYLPETPFCLFLMAFQARGCSMGSLQGEPSCVMLRHCVCKVIKPFNSMTLRTIRRYAVPGKLPAVIIGMAVCASVMFEGVGGFALMAIPAPNSQMFLLKLKICLVMIKP